LWHRAMIIEERMFGEHFRRTNRARRSRRTPTRPGMSRSEGRSALLPSTFSRLKFSDACTRCNHPWFMAACEPAASNIKRGG
jgi:hypothetical protein